jgi:hypothetical protein
MYLAIEVVIVIVSLSYIKENTTTTTKIRKAKHGI